MTLLTTDIMTVLHLLVQALFLLAGVTFAISAIDDLFIDAFFFYRYALRKYRLKFKYKPLSLDQLMAKSEQPLALMLPAWQEADVLYNAVSNLIYSINYMNYHVFIGTYPNDSATQAEADKLVSEFRHVHKVVTALPGPTCKADCLNAIIAAVYDLERTHDIEFVGVVIQDAEDVVHPLSLKLFNYLMPRFDLVQIPVFSLPREWTNLTGGHYMDEFAEFHSKEILVREYLAGIVPGAGVGTAYSRQALALAAEQGEIFSTKSLTEDYEFSTRMRNAGLKQIFARVSMVQTVIVETEGGEQKEVAIREIIATREYFPSRFWAAVRQKTRWTIGISLQGWQSLGWSGDWRARYLLWRDRKMLFFSHTILLGNFSLVIFFGMYIYHLLHPNAYNLAPLLEADHPFWLVVYFNLFVMVHRIVQRHVWTYRYYGWASLPMVLPRYIWGAVINYFALCRAIKIFLTHLITGQKIGWDKTAHDFPDEAQLKGHKQRLGELLVARHILTREQLDIVFEEQQLTGQRLGKLLLAEGLINEHQLMQALSTQFRVPVKTIDASTVARDVYGALPFDTLRSHRVVPLQQNEEGRLVVACEVVPNAMTIEQLEREAGCPLEFCLATESDISYGLHLFAMFAMCHAQGQAQAPLGARLLDLGLINESQLKAALRQQHVQHKPFEAPAVAHGHRTQQELDESVTAATQAEIPIGINLTRNGYISERACAEILAIMRHNQQLLEKILVETHVLLEEQLEEDINYEIQV